MIMLKTIKTLSLAAAFSVAGGLAAQAATFDFATLADTIGESTWGTSSVSAGWTIGGLTVVASGSSNILGDDADAYLDSGNAGLGVCSGSFGTGQCNPGSDDNVGAANGDSNTYETLSLSFSSEISLTSLTLRDSVHGLFNNGDEIYLTNSTTGYSDYFAVGTSDLLDWGVGSDWAFETAWGNNVIGDDVDRNSKEFYISSISTSPIPLPAGGLLLLTALGGMIAARRKRKAV